MLTLLITAFNTLVHALRIHLLSRYLIFIIKTFIFLLFFLVRRDPRCCKVVTLLLLRSLTMDGLVLISTRFTLCNFFLVLILFFISRGRFLCQLVFVLL